MAASQDAPHEQATRPGVAEALADAQRHARAALSELLRSLAALVEAAERAAAAGADGGEVRPPGRLRELLTAAAETLDGDGDRAGASLLEAVARALDAEIARWEARARDDADARAVLRAFLGLRELLWELGVRPARAGGDSARGAARRGPRVQRVPVEG